MLVAESSVGYIEIDDNEEEPLQVAWRSFLAQDWRTRVLGKDDEAKLNDAGVENYITLELHSYPTHCLLPSSFFVQPIGKVFAFLKERKLDRSSLIDILASLKSDEEEWLMDHWRRIERKSQELESISLACCGCIIMRIGLRFTARKERVNQMSGF